VPLTHYPKNSDNLVFAWVQPKPPDVSVSASSSIGFSVDGAPGEEVIAGPDFLGRPFSEINRFEEPIGPDDLVVGYHDAQPFTRFYGTIACDQPLEVTISFSNDEVSPDGRVVRDDNVHALHYDGEALRQQYDPKKQGPTGKFFVTIYGRFLRVEVKNIGTSPTEELRVFVRGSVF
jgi:hypothetical protein